MSNPTPPSSVESSPKGLSSYKYLTPGVIYEFVDKNNKSYGFASIPLKTNTTTEAPTDYLKITQSLNSQYTYNYITICNRKGTVSRVFIDTLYGGMIIYNKTSEKRKMKLTDKSPEVEFNVYTGIQVYAKTTSYLHIKEVNKKCGIVSTGCLYKNMVSPIKTPRKYRRKHTRKTIAKLRKTQRIIQ